MIFVDVEDLWEVARVESVSVGRLGGRGGGCQVMNASEGDQEAHALKDGVCRCCIEN